MHIKTAIVTMISGVLCHAVHAAPSTLTQTVTYNGETVTLNLKREDLRGGHFELLAQNASGGYDPVTPVDERSYLGTVTGYPGAVSYGILQDDGSFKGGIIFDRGFVWNILDTAVTSTSGIAQPTSFGYSASTVTPGQGGTTMYGFDIGMDARYEYYNVRGGNSVAKTLEMIEFSTAATRALYMRDALLRPYLGRVVVRTSAAHDPASGLTGGDYLSAVRNEWQSNQGTADRDVVAGVTTSHVWAGLAWVGVIATSSAYSVNDSNGDGNFNPVWRHELGHNWGLGHYDGDAPEGGTINSNNHFARMSGPEVTKALAQRTARLTAMDNLGTYTSVDLPPYASYDSATFTQVAQTQISIPVLANDHDANGDTLSLISVTPTTVNGGTASIVGQNVVYSPKGDFVGVDSFTYTVQDSSGQTAVGAVAVKVDVVHEAPAVTVVNGGFESGAGTGIPTGWTLTAGSSSSLGVQAGGIEGSKFLWIGPGVEVTQDLGHTMIEGEELTLSYHSSRSYARTIQFLAKSGGSYVMMGQTTVAVGSGSWPSSQMSCTVPATHAGQQLAVRIISGGWNEFDNLRVTSIRGASRPAPFNGATDVGVVDLAWTSLATAVQHHVYVGNNAAAVGSATLASPEYRGTVTGATMSFPTDRFTTCHWRVDTVTSSGTYNGPVWTFARNELAAIPLVNGSFESSTTGTGVPTGWSLTAGSGSSVGVGSGGSHGANFLWIGTGVQITQDLSYALTAGEEITLQYASSRTYGRTIQLLARSGGAYTVMGQTTSPAGSASWPKILMPCTVDASHAGKLLSLRVVSGNWNEFDDFRLQSDGGY